MEQQKAIDILEYHNNWRKGAGTKMIGMEELTEAMDTVVKNHNKTVEGVNRIADLNSLEWKDLKTKKTNLKH